MARKKPIDHSTRIKPHRKQREKVYHDGDELWSACKEYFAWVRDNPIVEEKISWDKGRVCRANVTHPRAMTLEGLAFHLGIRSRQWRHWRDHRPELEYIIDRVEQVIYTQKFELAAVNLMNPVIIARELGLAEKQDVSMKGPVDFRVISGDMTPEQAAEQYQRMRNGS